MSDPAWKKFERRVARLFGAERNPGSGSGGRADITGSDSTHPTLFVECKWSKARGFAISRLWRETWEKAKKEGKRPVLAIHDCEIQGAILVIHERDLQATADAVKLASRPKESK